MATALQAGTRELPHLDTPGYDEGIVRLFAIAAVFWAIVGLTMGVIIAFQLA
jgi:cbb3-type cytochrome oxidase subunit 1